MSCCAVAVIVASASLLTPPAMAADAADCAASWQAVTGYLSDFEHTASPPERTDTGRCALRDLSIAVPPYQRVEVEELSWDGDGLARLEEGLPPRSLDLRFTGARMLTVLPEDPVQSYLFQEMARAQQDISGGIRYHWSAHEPLVLDEAHVDFGRGNQIRLRAQLEQVDLSSLDSIAETAATAGISDLTLRIGSYGLFETLALMPLGSAVLSAEPAPEDQVDAMKARAQIALNALPETLLDSPSKAALSEVIASMPHPRGDLSLRLTSQDEGVRFQDLVILLMAARADRLDQLDALLPAVHLSVGWSPAP